MDKRVPRTWREQFDESLRRMTAGEGARMLVEPSIDAYLRQFPISPDQQWGAEMDELHRAALRASVLRHVAFISDDLERAVAVCASPPERAMLYALAIVGWDWVDGVLLRLDTGATGLMATHGTYIEIEPQAQIATHRVDFLLTMRLRTGPKPIVGHGWSSSATATIGTSARPSRHAATALVTVSCRPTTWPSTATRVRTYGATSSPRRRRQSASSPAGSGI